VSIFHDEPIGYPVTPSHLDRSYRLNWCPSREGKKRTRSRLCRKRAGGAVLAA